MSRANDSTGSEELKPLGGYPGSYQIGLWHNITVTTWFGPATVPAAQELSEITKRLMSSLPELRISVIHLVAPKLELPSNEVRSLFVQPLREYTDRFGCISVIVGGAGFWTSALRGFVTGMQVIAPRTFELRVHGDPGSLIEWFVPEHLKRTGVTIDSAALARVLAQAQAMQDAQIVART
jgi:hypothetical protein